MRRILHAMFSASTSPSSPGNVKSLHGKVLSQWKPSKGPQVLVMQGDLTFCRADAIVNAANRQLLHGGGLAAAIVRAGGSSIQLESTKWVQEHGSLTAGDAVTTAAGDLPSRFVIHTVGPNVGNVKPTLEHAKQLRRAVWSALTKAETLQVQSIAMPGISTGIFGYPRDLGAKEIVAEVKRFCEEKGETTTLQRIALMNNDDPTVKSFKKALEDAKKEENGDKEEDVSEQLSTLSIRD